MQVNSALLIDASEVTVFRMNAAETARENKQTSIHSVINDEFQKMERMLSE